MPGLIKKHFMKMSATNVSLNKKSLNLLSSLRDVMRLLQIEETKKKRK